MELLTIENDTQLSKDEPESRDERLDLNYVVFRVVSSHWMGTDGSLNKQKKAYFLKTLSNPALLDFLHEDVAWVGCRDIYNLLDIDALEDGCYSCIITFPRNYWDDDGDAEYDVVDFDMSKV